MPTGPAADGFVSAGSGDSRVGYAPPANLQARPMRSGNEAMIRRGCAARWGDDFGMRDFCEEQQLKALAAIR